jgi:hypothetical protein
MSTSTASSSLALSPPRTRQNDIDLLELKLHDDDDAQDTVDALFRKWRVGEIRGIENTAR